MFRFVCVCLYHSLRLSLKVVEYIIGDESSTTKNSDNSVGGVNIVFSCKCMEKCEQPKHDEKDTHCSLHILHGCQTRTETGRQEEKTILPSCEICELYHQLNHNPPKLLDVTPEVKAECRDVTTLYTASPDLTGGHIYSKNDIDHYFTDMLQRVTPKASWTYEVPATDVDKTSNHDIQDLRQALTFEKEHNARLTRHINELTLEILQKAPSLLEKK